jgi:hypothetical protein
MFERFSRFGIYTAFASTIAISSAARANETPSTPPCVAGTESDSLDATRNTLVLLADDYERQAVGYAKEAKRYRAWASADHADATHPRLSTGSFESRAVELDHAAAESRKLAEKYRALVYADARAQGC